MGQLFIAQHKLSHAGFSPTKPAVCQSFLNITQPNRPPYRYQYKNSPGDETSNVNFYAVRQEATRIRWNNAK